MTPANVARGGGSGEKQVLLTQWAGEHPASGDSLLAWFELRFAADRRYRMSPGKGDAPIEIIEYPKAAETARRERSWVLEAAGAANGVLKTPAKREGTGVMGWRGFRRRCAGRSRGVRGWAGGCRCGRRWRIHRRLRTSNRRVRRGSVRRRVRWDRSGDRFCRSCRRSRKSEHHSQTLPCMSLRPQDGGVAADGFKGMLGRAGIGGVGHFVRRLTGGLGRKSPAHRRRRAWGPPLGRPCGGWGHLRGSGAGGGASRRAFGAVSWWRGWDSCRSWPGFFWGFARRKSWVVVPARQAYSHSASVGRR